MRCALNDANTVDSLDPATFNATTMIVISRAVRDSLTEVGQDNSAAPGLAESWEPNADATTWRFKLRKGVEFSNGKSLTTEDVINSINVHRGEDSKSGAKGVFEGIEDVSADGSDVVVVKLKSANADFPFLMTDYHMNVVPSKDGKADVLIADRHGLYHARRLRAGRPRGRRSVTPMPGSRIEFGHIDSAEILAVLDDTARESALVSGEADVINRPGLKTIRLLRACAGYQYRGGRRATSPSRIPCGSKIPPFGNNDFRMALKHALPRQEFVDKILFGYGSIGNDQPLGPVFPTMIRASRSNTISIRPSHYLKKAGLEGTKFEMSAPIRPMAVRSTRRSCSRNPSPRSASR